LLAQASGDFLSGCAAARQRDAKRHDPQNTHVTIPQRPGRIQAQPERVRKGPSLETGRRRRVVFGKGVGEDGSLQGVASMSFKVIDGDGPGKEERERGRDREFAKHEFSWAIRDTAANMLRIIRGAGKPFELLLQMKKAIDSAIKFQELHNHWPDDVIANDLQLEDEMEKVLARRREGALDQVTTDRWWKDGTFDRMMAEHTIYRGALQAIASELIGQNTQKRSGESEFHDGIRQWSEYRRTGKRRKQADRHRPRESCANRQNP
jgi:hypothetical protein